ncbi:MAG: hypothetical protein ACR2RV_01795, partial [Verrucomicrobiales bacterium]
MGDLDRCHPDTSSTGMDEDPLTSTRGPNIAENGSAEKWLEPLPVGWELHRDHESPVLEQEASAKYVTDGATAVKVSTTRHATGILCKVFADPNAAYKVVFDTTLAEGTAKLMLSTTTEIHLDHVPMPESGPTTSEYTVVTGDRDNYLGIYFTSTTPQATFYVDNVRVFKIA